MCVCVCVCVHVKLAAVSGMSGDNGERSREARRRLGHSKRGDIGAHLYGLKRIYFVCVVFVCVCVVFVCVYVFYSSGR